MFDEKEYTPLATQGCSSEDQESLLSGHDDTYDTYRPSRTSQPKLLVSVIYCISAVCCMSLLGNMISVYLLLRPYNLDSLCPSYTTQHDSPISDAIPIKYLTTYWNGSFTRENIYRHRASPEVDAAWQDLVGAEPPHVAIPLSQARRYGLQPWQAKLDPSTPGLENTDEPHLIADVELFHQLHCLDLVRKGSYWDYPYYEAIDKEVAAAGGVTGPFSGDSEHGRRHFSHCVDMLRQRLMCSADTEVFGQVWIGEGGPDEITDGVSIMFSGERKCRNYDDIRTWVLENQVKPNAQGKIELSFVQGDRIFADTSDIP